MKHLIALPIAMIIVMLSITSITPLGLLLWSGVTLIGGLSVEVILEDTYIFEERMTETKRIFFIETKEFSESKLQEIKNSFKN